MADRVDPEAFLSLKQASKKLRPPVHKDTLRSWWRNGLLGADGQRVFLKTRKRGGRRYVTLGQIDAFLEAVEGME